MKVQLILLLLSLQTMTWATVDITPIQQICNPTNYETATAYWESLLKYKLVNSADKQTQKTILTNSNYADLVEIQYHTVNLFGTSSEEVVVQFTFNKQSSYIHCFYYKQADWYKTEYSLEYIDADQVNTRRAIEISFKEVYQKGEFVLLVKKTSQNYQINHTTIWLSIWQAKPIAMEVLLTEKIRMQTVSETYRTTLEWSNTLPALLSLKGETTTYVELVKEVGNETVIEDWVESATIEKKCVFEVGKPCQWEIMTENITSKRVTE